MNPSFPLVYAVAFLEESGQGFQVVLGLLQGSLEGGAGLQVLLESLMLREPQRPLGVAHGERRLGRDLAGDLAGARQQPVGLGDFQQDAERPRLLGFDDAPRQRELGGAL